MSGSSNNPYTRAIAEFVSALRYASHGRERTGVASVDMTGRHKAGDRLKVFLRGNAHFRLPADNAAIAGKIEPTAAGNRQHFRNTGRASHGNMLAGRENRRGGNDVRIVSAGFRGIDGGTDRPNLAQAHLRYRIE